MKPSCASSSRGLLLILLVISILLSACGSTVTAYQAPTMTETVQVKETSTPKRTTSPVSTPSEISPSPTALRTTVWVAPYLAQALKESVILEPGVTLIDIKEKADYWIEAGGDAPISDWVYALVAPFPTIPDGITSQELQDAWRGVGGGEFAGKPILMDEDTYQALASLWGDAAQGAVKVLDGGALMNHAWINRPSWGIVPFEELEPRWKVLSIDGQSPVRKEFDMGSYALSVPVSMHSNPASEDLTSTSMQASPLKYVVLSNWDASKLTTVILTGVTALVRATAETMRRNGITYPASEIGDILRSADLTHVSNEIPFTPDCPLPNPKQPDLKFCSKPEYIELLEYIGTDLVELSGDHFSDWGPEAMLYTLDLYQQAGIPYYGGGYTEEDARKPLLFEHNGNKLAFLGCNAKGGGYATARGDNPGAVDCDFEWLTQEIGRLVAEGYLPIVTFQHFEYYTYIPQPKLIEDFHSVAEAGAVIASGSQAHQPHGMEFYQGAFLHYGLGNLFFDQFHMGVPTGQGFLDRHVFYDGRHISTELIGIRFVNYALSRPMTPEEKTELLESVFSASEW